MCKKEGNTCKQLPLTAGYRFFKKLHGSIEDKFPCRYFWGRVKNKNQTIWVYSKKFAFQILNFFKMSISEPVFSLQTHIHLFIRYLQQIQYLITQFFCIDPKHRTPTADGMSFRRCLSGGGDIFSKSVERQGGANRTFATGGRCHGRQLEPCPYGLEPLLTFRQKIPTGRPDTSEGHSVRRGRSSGLRQPYVTSHAFNS